MRIPLILFISMISLLADLKIGSNFPALQLVDQFDHNLSVPDQGNQTVMLSFERDVSSQIKNFLNTKNKGFLEERNVTYISDISGMPSFVTSWFALPKMKEFHFKVGLIYDKNVGETLNREEGKVTLIQLRDNTISSIKFVNPKELNTLLEFLQN
ncbi:MAG TPA: hypothetical protein ENK86_06235 [Campylobacterales bacterium]|nr:hypothetical protein [Campylobacterales bacterium]